MSTAVIALRPARLADVPAIHALLREQAAAGNLLPRTQENLVRHVRDFVVAERDGQIAAVGALEIMGPDLGEVRSLAVAPAFHRQGIGEQVTRALLDQARIIGLRRVMALTYVPAFFARLGFEVVSKDTLPEKVWQVCVKCYKFNRCDEIAVMRNLEPAVQAG
ncbi:MAG TPA: N-acetyltransferase [Gammaproteobacteria bacterium]|jgi:amino-acid N-acetyltransferase|uniref:N-acetyltransferase n=1 Tax=Immundisolibacter sp. TaxID=1934948 RepID=UPI000E99D1E3|nr:N-acetyltransferase [Gammaproteobacteria bacterium]MCH76967.1 N-acetyltransferase [Gammaproteobacteria bacterium]